MSGLRKREQQTIFTYCVYVLSEKVFVFLGTQTGGCRWFTDLDGEAWKRPRAMGGRKKLGGGGVAAAEQQMDERMVTLRLLHVPLGPSQMVAQ